MAVLRFLSSHAAIYNCFNSQPHLISRPALRHMRAGAQQAWALAAAAAKKGSGGEGPPAAKRVKLSVPKPRIRVWVFGGVNERLLAACPVPVLFSP